MVCIFCHRSLPLARQTDVENVRFCACGLKQHIRLIVFNQLLDFAVFVIQIAESTGAADTAFYTNRQQAFVQSMDAEVAFFRRILVCRIRLSGPICAGLGAVHAVNTFVVVNYHDAVFRTLVGRLDRTGLNAGRILTVVALIRQRDHGYAVVIL